MQIGFQEIQKDSPPDFFEPQRLGNGWNNQVRISNRSQRNKENAVGKHIAQFSRNLKPQTSFTDSAGPGEGYESYLWSLQERTHGSYFSFTPNEHGELCR